MSTMKVILRWIAIVPAWLLANVIVNLGFALTSCYAGDFLAVDLARDSEGFGGHYILGPLLVILRSMAGGYAGMAAVVYVAPAAKREVAFVFSAILATVVVLGCLLFARQWKSGDLSGEALIRLALDLVPGAVTGFFVAASVPTGATDELLRRSDWPPSGN